MVKGRTSTLSKPVFYRSLMRFVARKSVWSGVFFGVRGEEQRYTPAVGVR